MDVRIHLFGPVGVSASDRRLTPFPTARSRSLFCFLVLNRRRMHARDVLAGIFWGDKPDTAARKNLRNDLWRVRGVLEPEGVRRGTRLVTEGDAVGISASAHIWVDVEEFERRIDATAGRPPEDMNPTDRDSLCAAVALYRGDLMEEIYDDWCLVDQQRLKVRLLGAIERLMRHHEARGEWESALLYGQRVLSADPLREHVQRDLMRFHYLRGDRPAALRQFESYARMLEAEMGIGPMRQTVRLQEAISSDGLPSEGAESVPHRDPVASAPGEARVDGPLDGELRSALRDFEAASARLRASLSRIRVLRPTRSPGE